MRRHLSLFKWCALLLVVLFTPIANADGLQDLKAFYANTKSMTADFHQVVSDNQGRKLQEVDGTMLIQRPNRFRWDYQKPFEQEIVSDGKYVYLYDVELEQVTVNPVTKALGTSPAALLSGSDDLEQNFNLQTMQNEEGLSWIRVTPKHNDTGFNDIALAFNKQGLLTKMRLVDSFGQQTAITFTQQNNNPNIPSETFIFQAPDGVDVLGR